MSAGTTRVQIAAAITQITLPEDIHATLRQPQRSAAASVPHVISSPPLPGYGAFEASPSNMAVSYVRAALVLLAAAMCVFLASASPRVLHQAKPAAKPVAKAAAALALPSSNALCVGPTAPAKFRYVW